MLLDVGLKNAYFVHVQRNVANVQSGAQDYKIESTSRNEQGSEPSEFSQAVCLVLLMIPTLHEQFTKCEGALETRNEKITILFLLPFPKLVRKKLAGVLTSFFLLLTVA